MRRYLVFVSPEPGHLIPTRSLCERLQQQGAEIIFATTPECAPLLAHTGFTVVNLHGQQIACDRLAEQVETQPLTGQSFWFRFSPLKTPARGHVLDQYIARLVQLWPCDVLLVDFLFSTKYFARFQQVRAANKICHLATSLPGWDVDLGLTPDPILVLCPKQLELPEKRQTRVDLLYGSPYVPTSAHASAHAPELQSSKAKERPLVLASFGTQVRLHPFAAKRLHMLISWALTVSQCDVLLATGSAYLKDELTAQLPAACNVRLVTTFAQQELLAQASLLITHGGLGSVKEAIEAGVPMVVFPVLADQPFNAIRVEAAHLGRAIFPEEASEEALRHAATCVLEQPIYRERVQRFQRLFLASEASLRSVLYLQSM